MTLIDLRDRLNEIIQENERRDWSRERNNMPAFVTVDLRTPTGREKSTAVHHIDFVSACLQGVINDGATVTGTEIARVVI